MQDGYTVMRPDMSTIDAVISPPCPRHWLPERHLNYNTTRLMVTQTSCTLSSSQPTLPRPPPQHWLGCQYSAPSNYFIAIISVELEKGYAGLHNETAPIQASCLPPPAPPGHKALGHAHVLRHALHTHMLAVHWIKLLHLSPVCSHSKE